MKILLIQPPVQDFYDTDIRLQPLGLCFLKSALLAHCPGVQVIIRDFHHGCGRQTIALPRELHYLKKYYAQPNTSPFSAFHQYYHFGLAFDAIGKKVKDEKPDLVGISSLFAPYYREVLRCAEAIKKEWDAPIVIGGGQATSSPELMLRHPAVDYIIRGEGEKPLVQLVQALMAGSAVDSIAGLGYKLKGHIHLNNIGANFSFNSLPHPDFSDLGHEKYHYKNEPLAFIQSSRGCPHRCSFCSVHQVFGRSHRKKNPETVVAEMEQRYKDGIRVFDFEDDNLTLDKKHILDLCGRIAEQFNNKGITLLAMNGVSHKNLDADILEQMKKAGFSRLNLALVSSEEKVLEAIHRPHQTDTLKEVIETAFSLGFELEVHQIIGLPHETLDSMAQSMAFLAELPVLIGVSIFYLTPGTQIAANFPEMQEDDIFKSRSTAMAFPSEGCSREDLFTLFTTARIINFIKGIDVQGAHTSLSELLHFPQENARLQSGMDTLLQLLTHQKFFTRNRQKYTEHTKFKFETFQKVWENMDAITTQKNSTIRLRYTSTPCTKT